MSNLMEEQEAQTSSAGAMPLIWKRLWGLPIHPKVKVFAWKCFNGAVATNSALAARKISTDPICSLCGKVEESICHLLFQCERASKVWILSPFRLRPEELHDCKYMSDWWACIQERITQARLPASSLGLGLTYCWWIWRMRNEAVFNGTWWQIETVSGKAQTDFTAFWMLIRSLTLFLLILQTLEMITGSALEQV